MAHRIVMPSFGMYTAEGTLGKWLKEPGARVEAGEVVVDLVTEKATYEVEAPESGVLCPVAVEGQSLVVEGLIGWILEDGESTPPASDGGAGATRGPGGVGAAEASAEAGSGASSVRASPLAKRLAAEHGIDLASLQGTGPGGRIVEADVLAAAERGKSTPALGGRQLPWRVRERIPLAGARKTIAERLRRSLDVAVPLTLTREVRAEALVEARTVLGGKIGTEVPFDALFLKIFGEALRERPALNAVIDDDAILVLDEVHVGFAVSLPGGLVVPVVRDAGSRALAEIAADVHRLAVKAREGRLEPQDVLGGTATITNLGAYGVDAFTPILNPPQSVILGIGRIAARPVVEDGRVAAGVSCVLSLTFDHRVADGAPAAELLDAVARRMGDAAHLDALA
jgi:pyruvate/2-oxoglutarate dehydrogenase complex dihydrolipoamide acyltransferase (E2) component